MLMSYNRGEIDLFFNDKGHLDFSKKEELRGCSLCSAEEREVFSEETPS